MSPWLSCDSLLVAGSEFDVNKAIGDGSGLDLRNLPRPIAQLVVFIEGFGGE